MEGWVKVYESMLPHRAELLRGWLAHEYEIDAVVLSKQDSAYLWGHHEIHVPVKDAVFAEWVLRNEETNTDETE
ncbi:hypothetical protein SAMN04488090_3426 [Siphonobacter aquaeclarae]|uniref:DUF2007 domain-containing protein n=2 Tax=Siphonobacter aquaeclarae TaxID=563176 RepID=A0A1G9T7M8_9BACT|nr:hypothetical protein SAMN04488090_3426 [Siphonobacter aquaeclarae]